MLSINIWDLLWTVIDFFLLYFLLKKLLYEPLLRFMDERRARIDAGLEAERRAEGTLAENDRELQAQLEESRQEAKRILEEARAQAGADKAAWTGALKQESQRQRDQLRQEELQRREQEGEQLAAQEAQLARALAGRLLNTTGEQGA